MSSKNQVVRSYGVLERRGILALFGRTGALYGGQRITTSAWSAVCIR